VKARLAQRWSDAAGTERVDEILRRVQYGASLEGMGLGVYEGRIDLRGLPAGAEPTATLARSGSLEMRRLSRSVVLRGTLADVDLSDSQLAFWRVTGAALENCRFDQADCRGWVMKHSTVRNGSFVGANLRGSLLSAGTADGRVAWEKVSLAKADLRGAVFLSALLVDCTFAEAKGVEFCQCDILRSVFTGGVTDVLFDGRGITARPEPGELDADFSHAIFTEVEFRGYGLDRVQLPLD